MNLMGVHPIPGHGQFPGPFQIDGNLGFTAGVHEMLFQSHAGYIHLLPTLPGAWADGHITGARTVGGHTLEIKWNGGSLELAKISAFSSGDITVRNTDFAASGVYVNGAHMPGDGDTITFPATANETYAITTRACTTDEMVIW